MANPVRLDYAVPPQQSTAPAAPPLWVVWVAGILGLGLGLICTFLSLLNAGAGHGWNVGASISWISLFTAPLATIAWTRRRTPSGTPTAILLLVVALAANALLYFRSDVEDVDRAFAAGFLIFWAITWFGWQAIALATLCFRHVGSAPPTST